MNKSSYKVSDLGEKELINRIITKNRECSSLVCDFSSNFSSTDFKTTIGDDCGLISHNLNEFSYLVTTSDMLIQSTHFPKAMSYYQMGYKSVVVNVSDLAAMGAKPIGLVLSLAIPKDLLLDDFDELICGVIGACNDYNIPLIGGDTNEADQIIISATAFGEVNKDKALMKYGFNIGDLVAVTGEIGLAALGFELLNNPRKLEKARGIDSSFVDLAIFKALKPKACQDESYILAKYNNKKNYTNSKSFHTSSRYNISATDITDGLASELYELLERDMQFNTSNLKEPNMKFNTGNLNIKECDMQFNTSNLNQDSNLPKYSKSILLYEDSLPIEDEFKKIATAIGCDYLDLFFHVGEDFELLFTVPKELVSFLKEELDFFIIGEIVENKVENELIEESNSDNKINNFTLEMVLSNNNIITIDSKGYEHLI